MQNRQIQLCDPIVQCGEFKEESTTISNKAQCFENMLEKTGPLDGS